MWARYRRDCTSTISRVHLPCISPISPQARRGGAAQPRLRPRQPQRLPSVRGAHHPYPYPYPLTYTPKPTPNPTPKPNPNPKPSQAGLLGLAMHISPLYLLISPLYLPYIFPGGAARPGHARARRVRRQRGHPPTRGRARAQPHPRLVRGGHGRDGTDLGGGEGRLVRAGSRGGWQGRGSPHSLKWLGPTVGWPAGCATLIRALLRALSRARKSIVRYV